MIDRLEIMEFSREVGLAPEIVEKDYVLGWVLGAIFNRPSLRLDWLFKGGTCLKKCYFETYRFSKDLDFTLRNPDHLDQEFLETAFSEVAEWIYDQSGIEMPRDTIAFEICENPRGKISIQGRLGYRGPLQRRGSTPRIKLDSTDDERIVLDPIWREVHHPYDVIQCMHCGRRFSRKNHETLLNPHKNKSGHPCLGRSGFLVETKY